jgi:hypothetical protein
MPRRKRVLTTTDLQDECQRILQEEQDPRVRIQAVDVLRRVLESQITSPKAAGDLSDVSDEALLEECRRRNLEMPVRIVVTHEPAQKPCAKSRFSS